ncbi:hypothetical protein [Natronospora cellulosivora (SeqCode)]
MRMKKKLLYLSIILFFILSFNNLLFAGMTARTIGLADDFPTITGIDALYANPASINAGDHKFALELSANAGFWNNVFVNDFLDDAYKENVLNKIADDGLLMDTDINLGTRINIGAVTAFADARGNVMMKIAPDLAELILDGNQNNKNYKLTGSEFTSAIYGDTGLNLSLKMPDSLSNSMQVNNIYVGMTYHYLIGTIFKSSADGSILLELEGSNPRIEDNIEDFFIKFSDIENGDFAIGHAFDIGLYTELSDKLALGLSVFNIDGSMSVDAYRHFELYYNEEEETWDFTEEIEGEAVEGVLNYTLPLIFKVGGRISFTDNFDLHGGYTMTSYNDDIFKDSLSDHKFALGAEYSRIGFLPLRMGMNYSTLQHNYAINTGMGLHLGSLKADLGISDLSGLFYRSKGVEIGLNMKIEF